VKNLFVGNLGSEVTHEALRRLFEAYGQVVQVHIIVDRDTGLNMLPFRARTASSASASLVISTNANPRGQEIAPWT
jgi:hypothetical protein